MSNASLKEQLQAVASQLSDTLIKTPQEKPRGGAPAKRGSAAPKNRSSAQQKGTRPPAKNHQAAAPKPKWLELAQYGVALLRTYFPATFKTADHVQPLKKGIKEDLVKRLSTLESVATDDKACMVKSLSFYVNSVSYHRKVIAGAMRIDLDGQPAGSVTEEEALYSQEKLQHKKNKGKKTSSQLTTSSSMPSSSETPADGNETR